MTLREHRPATRKAIYCIRRLTGQLGMCPDVYRRALVVCAQATALYGAALWRDDRKARGEEPVRRAPKAGESAREAITGNFRTTNLGVVMAEPSREATEQQKPTPRADADVVT